MVRTFIKSTLINILLLIGITSLSYADFYVIPIGKSSIKTSDVKHLRLSYYAGASSATIYSFHLLNPDGTTGGYAVPDGKVFVITSLTVIPHTISSTGVVYFELKRSHISDHTVLREFHISASDTKKFNFTPGLVVQSGDDLGISNATSSATSIMVYVNGYETNP